MCVYVVFSRAWQLYSTGFVGECAAAGRLPPLLLVRRDSGRPSWSWAPAFSSSRSVDVCMFVSVCVSQQKMAAVRVSGQSWNDRPTKGLLPRYTTEQRAARKTQIRSWKHSLADSYSSSEVRKSHSNSSGAVVQKTTVKCCPYSVSLGKRHSLLATWKLNWTDWCDILLNKTKIKLHYSPDVLMWQYGFKQKQKKKRKRTKDQNKQTNNPKCNKYDIKDDR